MNLINFNGQLFPADRPIFTANSRSLKYGDGLFETIRMFDGRLPFWERHYNRLEKGFEVLKFQIPDYYHADFFKSEIQKLVGKRGNARIRLSVNRKANGLYLPLDQSTDFLIEANPLNSNEFTWETRGLKVDLYEDHSLPTHKISSLKTANGLAYILAAIYKKEQGLDDCLILNDAGAIAEASSSNLFCYYNKALHTTDEQQGAVAGTMQAICIELAQQEGIEVKQGALSPEFILEAEEVFLTNAIHGIRWIQGFREKEYTCHFSQKIFKALLQKTKENQ